MERKKILRQLLSLSRYHHSLVVKEKWNQWESVADQKEELAGCVEKGGSVVPDEEERLLLTELAKWEQKIKDALNKRKKETADRLIKVKRARHALADYGKANRGHDGPHFGIRC